MKVRLCFVNESELDVDLDFNEWKLMYRTGSYNDQPILCLHVIKDDSTLGPAIPLQAPRVQPPRKE